MKIGAMELFVIIVVLILVLGPQKTVQYAYKLGKWLRVMKVYVGSLMGDIQETVIDPLQEPIKEITEPLQELQDAIQAPVKEFNDAVWELKRDAPVKEAPQQEEEPLEFAEPDEAPEPAAE